MIRKIFSSVFYSFLLFLALLISTSSVVTAKEKMTADKAYKAHEVLVRFYPEVSESEKEAVRTMLGAVKIKTVKSIRVEYWRLPGNVSTEEALELLRNNPNVESAEPNYIHRTNAIPNDPFFDKQWYLYNYGQYVNGTIGRAGADISAIEAWNVETGNSNIVIAVIDTGVAYTHPDLIDNIWINRDEIPNNGFDDDNNGYIDDVRGWDFANNDNDPSDVSRGLVGDGHGTHVAGIIGAASNNAQGISGILWHTQIMPLLVSPDGSELLSDNIVSAIEYAVDNGAKIINCSFGGPNYSSFEYDVIDYANKHGVLLICAAGNEGQNNDLIGTYPANYDLPNVIAVAATDEKDHLPSYSNYGKNTVDIAAPGGNSFLDNIFSSVPPEREIIFYEDFSNGYDRWFSVGVNESWSFVYDYLFHSIVATDSLNNYHANESSYLTLLSPLDCRDYKGLVLDFKIYSDLEDGYDFCYLESSKDNVSWDRLYEITGKSFGISDEYVDLSMLDLSQFFLSFHLVTDYSENYQGVKIDDLELSGIPNRFSGDEFDFMAGTSMATPVVSGVAGLVWSHNPNLSHLQVKGILMASVDSLYELSDKVLSGGRINAYKALSLSSGWIALGGEISHNDLPLTAMVLANGQYTFSSSSGHFNLAAPLDSNGNVILFAFADGFLPAKKSISLSEASDIKIQMNPADAFSPKIFLTIDFISGSSKPNWVTIGGYARNENGIPLSAMILANGQYVFSDSSNGFFSLEAPLDSNGQISIFAFADGFMPYKKIFSP